MRFELRTAALSPEMERRVRLAAATLAAHRIHARVAPWEGWRCAAVVLDIGDAYGRRVAELARQHQVAVVSIGADADEADPRALPADASVALLSRTLLAICAPDSPADSARNAPAAMAVSADEPASASEQATSIFQQLARDYADDDIELRSATRAVYLLRSRGRVLARSLSDILLARDRLGDGTFVVRVMTKSERPPADAEVASSLDTFLVGAALRQADTLPSFPAVSCRLADWPDLGSATDAVEALQLAGVLMRRAQTPNVAAAATGIPSRIVAACFWAFAAGGLFADARSDTSASPAPVPTAPARADGLLARLAAHFGLGRRSA